MAEPFLGQIMAVGFNYAPVNWAPCDGRTVSIQAYTALFSLFGTTYGGDGRSNFGVPDLRGRAAIGMGQGSGTSNYYLGQTAGSENVTLSIQQMPAHNHGFTVDGSTASTSSPSGGNIAQPTTTPGKGAQAIPSFTTGAPSSPATLNNTSVQNNGGGQGFSVIQPVLAINYIVCLNGIYPPRP